MRLAKQWREKYGISSGNKTLETAVGRAWLDSLDETARRVWLRLNKVQWRGGDYSKRGAWARAAAIGPRATQGERMVRGALEQVDGTDLAGWMERFARSEPRECGINSLPGAAIVRRERVECVRRPPTGRMTRQAPSVDLPLLARRMQRELRMVKLAEIAGKRKAA